jgi:hypothetical protein
MYKYAVREVLFSMLIKPETSSDCRSALFSKIANEISTTMPDYLCNVFIISHAAWNIFL